MVRNNSATNTEAWAQLSASLSHNSRMLQLLTSRRQTLKQFRTEPFTLRSQRIRAIRAAYKHGPSVRLRLLLVCVSWNLPNFEKVAFSGAFEWELFSVLIKEKLHRIYRPRRLRSVSERR
jgi:hypothetical protein